MLEKLNVGVIGVGFIGELHARIYSEINNTNLVAVVDINEQKGREIAGRYNCSYYPNMEELFTRSDIDAVSICLPDTLRLEPVLQAAEAGKHILLEKPIARSVEEAERIKKVAEQNGIRLMVAHVMRFDPRYVLLHDQIIDGNIGELIHIRAKRQNPKEIQERLKGVTSMLYYIGVHDIDLTRWISQSEVEEVFARKVSKIYEEDCIFALLKFKCGAIGSLEFSWSLPNNFSSGLWSEMEVVGTKGAGYIDVMDQGLKLFVNNTFIQPDTLHWPEYNGQINGDLKEELMHFADAIINNKDFLMPTEDAIKAIAIIEGIQKSVEEMRPVKIS